MSGQLPLLAAGYEIIIITHSRKNVCDTVFTENKHIKNEPSEVEATNTKAQQACLDGIISGQS